MTVQVVEADVNTRLGLELVHIWDARINFAHAICGSKHQHICPESRNGDDIALLDPGSTRCWCGARICGVCRRGWEAAIGDGTWPEFPLGRP